jgi:hypothetical protein
MPAIQWENLPPSIKRHLFLRAEERMISREDILRLLAWRKSQPNAPDGPWYKDFGSFKLCGEGRYPKTLLLAGQAARGERIE